MKTWNTFSVKLCAKFVLLNHFYRLFKTIAHLQMRSCQGTLWISCHPISGSYSLLWKRIQQKLTNRPFIFMLWSYILHNENQYLTIFITCFHQFSQPVSPPFSKHGQCNQIHQEGNFKYPQSMQRRRGKHFWSSLVLCIFFPARLYSVSKINVFPTGKTETAAMYW